ncbi:class I lanthipeptide [Lacinutrix neustonica]|uniref:Class I lanthipeptide n=1 Tax=Lacinutrix neustonica TaxID=2980107 RepID=A0A9E8SDC0_9FLAO|nr:class I lanthipeptide [Lacinutrix neustonica]WAC01054.1 class I lanthipeptide [Lacinutrix neustonica]
MKTNKKSLDFNKSAVIELNKSELNEVRGGNGTTSWVCLISSLVYKFEIDFNYDAH